MSDLGKFIGGFGEQLAKTLESERKRKKEENEFNQDMAYKYRQQNLMMNYYQQQEDRMRESESREKEVQEFNIRSGFQEVSPESGGFAGSTGNIPFDKALMPFEEGKYYAEKQPEGKMFDLYENMGTELVDGKPMDRKRNKQTGKIEYFPHYEKPEKGIGGGNKEPKPEEGLKDKYVVDAWNRLRNPGLVTKDVFGNELYANTPEQKDADFNTLANSKLTPSALRVINGMRKGTGDYPTMNEIIETVGNSKLNDADKNSVEDFLEFYSQIEVNLAPQKKQWWKQ